jgi:hypothetical protein
LYISGLVDGSHYDDYELPVPDRTYHLVNTDLQAWNIYPYDSLRLVIASSIFGEMLVNDSAYATMNNSTCDGSGGYIGADENSQFEFFGSTINTQFIARNRAFMIAGYSNIDMWPAQATGATIMLLLFCNTPYEPQARDTSLIFISDFRLPPDAQVGPRIPILGTADIRNGPAMPLTFGSYQMVYASGDSPNVWHDVDTVHEQPVTEDTLDVWDARSLPPGTYLIGMNLKDSEGDSIEPAQSFTLLPTGTSEQPGARKPSSLTLAVPSPNPCRTCARIFFSLPTQGRASLKIYDASGRLKATPFAGDCAAGTHEVQWNVAAENDGLYFVRLSTPQGQRTERLIVTR